MKFSSSVLNELKYYVYLYSHPKTREIFYVGKGKGNHVFAHLDDNSDSQKAQYIKELKTQNLKPKIEILIHGLEDEKTALRVEASMIDLLGIKNLTNKQGGYKSALFGRMTIDQLKSAYNKQKVEITEPSILIRINQAFRYTMSENELYDFTRGQWKINPQRANNAKLGFAIYEGIFQEVYEILNWYEAGATFSIRNGTQSQPDRYEFIGNLASDVIRKKYRYKSIEHYFKKGNSNPIMYVNV